MGNWYIKSAISKRFLYLTLAFDRVVLHGTIAFSITVLSPKKQEPSFFKKVLAFQKTHFKISVLETLKISCVCCLKTYQSLKWRIIVQAPSAVF